MSQLKYIAVSHISDLEKVKDKDSIVFVNANNSFYAHYRNKWLYLAPYSENEEKPVKPKHTNCINCGAPLKGSVCEYCGTRY